MKIGALSLTLMLFILSGCAEMERARAERAKKDADFQASLASCLKDRECRELYLLYRAVESLPPKPNIFQQLGEQLQRSQPPPAHFPQPLNCTSTRIGPQVYTSCN